MFKNAGLGSASHLRLSPHCVLGLETPPLPHPSKVGALPCPAMQLSEDKASCTAATLWCQHCRGASRSSQLCTKVCSPKGRVASTPAAFVHPPFHLVLPLGQPWSGKELSTHHHIPTPVRAGFLSSRDQSCSGVIDFSKFPCQCHCLL